MSQLLRFANDHFKVLACLYDEKNSNNVAHVTQQEIADRVGLSRVTINKIIGELKQENYIQLDGVHVGRYVLTPKASNVVKAFRSVERDVFAND